MKQFILKNKNAISAIACCLLFGGVMLSFGERNSGTRFTNQDQPKDTVPVKDRNGKMTMKDFDRLTEQPGKDMLKPEDINKIDFENIERQIELSMKSVDMGKIMKDVELSMKDIDIDKIMKELELSLKTVDMEKTMADVRASMKDIDWEKTSVEMKNALAEAKKEMEKAKTEMKNINQGELKKELENARKELESAKDEIKKIDMEGVMKRAREGIEQAKSELKEMKTMFNEMEKDGLINPKEGFKIEYRNKDLYINGEKQELPVTDKYRKYFKDEHFEIEIDKE